MTISPLLKELEQFAVERKPLAYLDDILLFTDIGKKQTILSFLQSDGVFNKYNLRANTTKTVEFSMEALRRKPMKILGTYSMGQKKLRTGFFAAISGKRHANDLNWGSQRIKITFLLSHTTPRKNVQKFQKNLKKEIVT